MRGRVPCGKEDCKDKNMNFFKWIGAFYRSRIGLCWPSSAVGWDPDVDSAQRVNPRAEWRILAGFSIALLSSIMRPVIDGWSLHPLAPQFAIYVGIALVAAGWRNRLQRWLYRSWREGWMIKLTKSEVDGALQLSYVLTTAGGLSLMSIHSRWFAILVAGNIFAGIIVLDAARQLTRRQSSEDGVVYALINTGIYGCINYLLRAQVVFSMLALTWLLVRQL